MLTKKPPTLEERIYKIVIEAGDRITFTLLCDRLQVQTDYINSQSIRGAIARLQTKKIVALQSGVAGRTQGYWDQLEIVATGKAIDTALYKPKPSQQPGVGWADKTKSVPPKEAVLKYLKFNNCATVAQLLSIPGVPTVDGAKLIEELEQEGAIVLAGRLPRTYKAVAVEVSA